MLAPSRLCLSLDASGFRHGVREQPGTPPYRRPNVAGRSDRWACGKHRLPKDAASQHDEPELDWAGETVELGHAGHYSELRFAGIVQVRTRAALR